MSNQQEISTASRVFRFILKVIIVIVIVAGLGYIVYYGSSLFYENYVQVLNDHSMRLKALESEQQSNSNQMDSRLDEFDQRLGMLEKQADTQKETIAEFSSELETLQTSVETLETNQNELTDQVDDIAVLKNHIRQFQQNLDELNQDIDSLSKEISQLSTSLYAQEDAIGSIGEGLSANMDSWRHMDTQLKTLRVMGLLNRSRFYLAQGNLKIAKIGIENARDILLSMKDDVSDTDADTIDAIVLQLNKALNALPRYPVLAADRLEGAWDMLVNNFFPPPPKTETAEPSVDETAPASGTPVPTPTVTPAPGG